MKGKNIGVNGLSGGAWIFAMLTLDYWGLSPERDNIQFRALGDQGVIAQGLSAGAVDAAFLGYTFGKALESKGFRILADVEKIVDSLSGVGNHGAAQLQRIFTGDRRKRIESIAR